jgi:ferritin-like metal-binding protein YciE
MQNEAVKHLLTQGLHYVQAAGEIGSRSAAKTAEQASHPDLKQILDLGAKNAQQWHEKLQQCVQQLGGVSEPQKNEIVEAISMVSDKISQQTKDPMARDLGIIAAGQMALHYYIAAFGTLASYAEMLDMPEQRDVLRKCLQEAKTGDEKYTQLATQIGKS